MWQGCVRALLLSMNVISLPTDLRSDLAAAMIAEAEYVGPLRDARQMDCLAQRASTYARRLGLTPEGMVVAIRCVYEDIRHRSSDDVTRLREAYDHVLSACLRAYFQEAGPTHT